jgi:hypothetical protein
MMTSEWHANMIELGYTKPLPASARAIHATLGALTILGIYELMQEKDRKTLLDCDEDGESASLFPTTLDLSQ